MFLPLASVFKRRAKPVIHLQLAPPSAQHVLRDPPPVLVPHAIFVLMAGTTLPHPLSVAVLSVPLGPGCNPSLPNLQLLPFQFLLGTTMATKALAPTRSFDAMREHFLLLALLFARLVLLAHMPLTLQLPLHALMRLLASMWILYNRLPQLPFPPDIGITWPSKSLVL